MYFTLEMKDIQWNKGHLHHIRLYQPIISQHEVEQQLGM